MIFAVNSPSPREPPITKRVLPPKFIGPHCLGDLDCGRLVVWGGIEKRGKNSSHSTVAHRELNDREAGSLCRQLYFMASGLALGSNCISMSWKMLRRPGQIMPVNRVEAKR